MKHNLITFAISLSSLLAGGAQADYLSVQEGAVYQDGLRVGAISLNDQPVIMDIGNLGDDLLDSGADYFSAASFTTNSASIGANILDLSINHELYAFTSNNSATANFDFKTLVSVDGNLGDGGKLGIYAFAPVNFGVSMRINPHAGQALGDPVKIDASAVYDMFDDGNGNPDIERSGDASMYFFLNNSLVGSFAGASAETSFIARIGDTLQLYGSSQSVISTASATFAAGENPSAMQASSMKAAFTVTPV